MATLGSVLEGHSPARIVHVGGIAGIGKSVHGLDAADAERLLRVHGAAADDVADLVRAVTDFRWRWSWRRRS